jgi:hypothetical protein
MADKQMMSRQPVKENSVGEKRSLAESNKKI